MKPPFDYYGGKTRLADWVVAQFPAHRVYLEPYCGSAAVLFAKPPALHEILNDLDGNVVHFFRTLREQPEALELACRLTPYARDEHAAARAGLNEPGLADVERARRWYVIVSQSYAKQSTNATGFSSSIQRGSNNARSVLNRIGRFQQCVERLERVTIENRDALACIDEYSHPQGVIYADPPYLGETRASIASGKRSSDYQHDMTKPDPHRQLAAALRASPSAVFLSGYHSPLYDELYDGWWRLERRVVRGTANRGAAGGDPHATEVLWTNREPHGSLFDLEIAR